MESKHLIDNSGIFLGLSTIPLPLKQGKAFFEREIQQGIFKKYKDRIRDFSFNIEKDDPSVLAEFEEYFYEVRAFYLFGRFDLAVLSLVDDFKLGSKTFHPYSHLTEDALLDKDGQLLQPENFIFQTQTGYAPQLITEYPSLLEQAKDTFLKEKSSQQAAFPLFASCSLKLNSAFTIGSGDDFLKLVASMIYSRLEASPDFKEHFDFILLQSFSWNEFTILFFADSYDTITKHILEVRELSFDELKLFDYGNSGLLDSIRKEALLTKLLEKEQESEDKLDKAHIFVHSQTIFGFDIDLFDEKNGEVQTNRQLFKPILDDNLKLNIQLFVKPGHLKTVAKHFHNKSKNWHIHIESGNFVYPIPNGDLESSYKELLNNTDLRDLNKHIRRIQTHPEFTLSIDEIAGKEVDEHYFYTGGLYHYAFGIASLKDLRKNLISCKISKTVRERVINMYVNYNNGIQDPVLYGYFIDLKPFLDKTLLDVAQLATEEYQSVEESSEVLDILTSDFEKAFHNRFHLSYLMSEMTDFNMEFNGGVQQLVSLFDSVYKIMSGVLLQPYDNCPTLCVSSISGIVSNDMSVEMSYAHLLQPSLFLSTATASAAKSFLSYVDLRDPTFERFEKKTTLVQSLSLIEQLPFLEDLSDLFGDMINYYITFNKDTELFLFWYWHYFLQNPNMYNQKGEVNEELFLIFLLRLMLLVEYLDPESNYFKSRVVAPSHDLQDLWFRWFPRTRQKLNEILEDELVQDLNEWFTQAKSIIEDRLIIDNYTGLVEKNIQTEDEKRTLYKEILRNSESSTLNDLYDLESEILKARMEEMEFLSEQVSSLLKKGRVYNPDVPLARSSAFYVQVIVYAYLKLLYKESKGNLSILYRENESGKPSDTFEADKDFKRLYPDFTFDPRGGLFLTSIKARRDYFQYRVALYNSLHGIASKKKRELF